jgi:hypothetical protein
MTFFPQARRTCGATHFIRPCTILHATGIGLPPNFEDCALPYIPGSYHKTTTFVIENNVSPLKYLINIVRQQNQVS